VKLPDIVQQPVGEFALGNIPQPRPAEVGKKQGAALGAVAGLFVHIANDKKVAEVDEATGEAAREMAELRAILVNSNTVDAEWVGDDALGEIQVSSTTNGEREVDTSIKMFTHEIAEEVWEKRSQEIIAHYAGTISSPKAREKFIGEMNERYAAPGTQAVLAANIIRSRAYGQAQAETAVEAVLSSNAPTEVRESNAKEIISRQLLLGADPVWAEKQLSDLGPAIDQIDVHNDVLGAQTADEIDQIEEDMWTSGNRMTPEQMRTMSSQMDARRRDFLAEDRVRQDETADKMFLDYHNPEVDVNEMDVANAVNTQQITREAGWTFINSMNAGGTTKVSDQFTLSQYRGEIFKLQYTGGEGNLRVTDKARLLKLMISRGSMGLTPQGTPTGLPPTISGVDALTLNKEIDAAVKLATENEEYKNAFQNVLLWTRSKLDLEGQIVTAFGGDQNQVEAAVAFKNALDNYMNTYGADAKPSEFFEANKDAYDPRKFSSGVNGAYLKAYPQAKPFMTQVGAELEFTQAQQENYLLWLSDNIEKLGAEKYQQASALFRQYYRGQGIPPNGGALMLEPDDPLYRQFQDAIPNE
jgi:hypothetical protein